MIQVLTTRRIDNPQWYALRVQPQKEYAVQHMLERQDGIWVYVPTGINWRRRTRYNKEAAEYACPELPGLVFARFPDDPAWFDVLRNHLVIGPIGRNGAPWQLREAELFDYFARTPNGTLVIDDGEALIQVGRRRLRAPRNQVRLIAKRHRSETVEPTRQEIEVLEPLIIPAVHSLDTAA